MIINYLQTLLLFLAWLISAYGAITTTENPQKETDGTEPPDS